MMIHKLEFRKTLKTRRFWIIMLFGLLMYFASMSSVGSMIQTTETPEEALILKLVGFVTLSAYLFFSILALLLGSSAFSEDFSKGTVKIVLSKPISKKRYFLGKFISHTLIISFPLILFTVLTVFGLKGYNLKVTSSVLTTIILTNTLLFLSLLQFLALGYLISILVKSPNIALGITLIIFFLVGGVLPSLIKETAHEKALKEFNAGNWEKIKMLGTEAMNNYSELEKEILREYTKKYLFYAPNVQVKSILEDMFRSEFTDDGKTRIIFLGPVHAFKNNVSRFVLLIVPTLVYLIVGYIKFKKMDLR